MSQKFIENGMKGYGLGALDNDIYFSFLKCYSWISIHTYKEPNSNSVNAAESVKVS